MLLKILFRFVNKPAITRLFEITNVLHSQDDIGILNKTVLHKIADGLRNIKRGGRFIVDNNMQLFFDQSNTENLCDVPTSLYINGDLKYFAQMLGRDGMSTSWCMWCQAHPNEWRGLFSVPLQQLWSISQQVEYVQRIEAGVLKEPREKKGIVSLPLIDFIEPHHYIFPQLHFEIGAVNNVLDYLRGFIEEEVEILSDAEREARNNKIIADVSYIKAKDKLHDFSTTGGSVELNMYRLERVHLTQALKPRNLTQDERDSLLAQRQELDDAIKSLLDQQKRLKADASAKRKIFAEASKALKDIQSKKSKIDTPTIATMENIFLKFEVSPAKYHGGKLNGVDCREVMSRAKDLFRDIQELLLSIVHPQRCSEETIKARCNICRDILATLDLICSKNRIRQGNLQDNDLSELRRAIESLDYLWEHAGLSFTPKIHGMLAHAADQVELLGGIGDMLEDDLEHLHQISKKISDRTSRIKNKHQQALSHSQMESKLQNKEIISKTMESQLDAKRVFKKARVDSSERVAQAKLERDISRIDKLVEVEAKPFRKIISFYENEKASLLNSVVEE